MSTTKGEEGEVLCLKTLTTYDSLARSVIMIYETAIIIECTTYTLSKIFLKLLNQLQENVRYFSFGNKA